VLKQVQVWRCQVLSTSRKARIQPGFRPMVQTLLLSRSKIYGNDIFKACAVIFNEENGCLDRRRVCGQGTQLGPPNARNQLNTRTYEAGDQAFVGFLIQHNHKAFCSCFWDAPTEFSPIR
jgi:hypothetical protein